MSISSDEEEFNFRYYFILNEDGSVTPVEVREWAKWYENADRSIAKYAFDKYDLSAVFLGINHNYGEGPPLIFEMMIFKKGTYDEVFCERFSTKSETLLRAQELVHLIESGKMKLDD